MPGPSNPSRPSPRLRPSIARRACSAFAVLLLAGAAPSATRGESKLAPPDQAPVRALLEGVANVTCPIQGVVTGGQIAAVHVKKLSRSGFRTLLDLRTREEKRGFAEAQEARRAGLVYVNIPVSYTGIDDALFDQVRGFMSEPRHHPVMVHCASGNRVGVVLLPWLVLDLGWELDAALAMAEKGGMRAGPTRESALDYITRQRAKR